MSTKYVIYFPEKQLLRFCNNVLYTDQLGGECSALTCSHAEHTGLAKKDKANCSVKYN